MEPLWPMACRKRAMEIAEIIIDAQVVYENER